MPQTFEGDWRSILIPDTGGPIDNLQFHLHVDPTNRLLPSSTHLGGAITGDVTDYSITIIETFTPTSSITYVGNLCGEVRAGGRLHLMVCGVATLVTLVPLDEETIAAAEKFPVLRDMLERNSLFDQIQEIWVATKP